MALIVLDGLRSQLVAHTRLTQSFRSSGRAWRRPLPSQPLHCVGTSDLPQQLA